MILLLKATGLFTLTAAAEIIGCFLVYRWVRQGGPLWLLPPAAVSLGMFAWLLTLHPGAAGRTYAAYGAVYIASAVVWLWLIEGQRPTLWDVVGVAVCLVGTGIILLGSRIQ